MKKLITCCYCLAFLTNYAQTFEWLQTPPVSFDANASLLGYPNTCDSSGNIYVAGYLGERFYYGDVFGHIFLNKYSSDGILLFSKTIEGHAQVYNIKSDAQGNVYMVAGYVNMISIGTFSLNTVNQGVQPLLFKFDFNGNLLWHLPLNTVDPFIQHAESLAIDNDSNSCYVAFDNFDDAYIQKISADGAILSTITQIETNRITSLSVDSAGNLYAAGSCASITATYAGVSAPTDFFYNTYVVKYNPSGQFQWVRYVDDITCSTPMVVARHPDEVYFCSHLFGPYAFDDFTAEGPASNAFGDFFLTRLNANGQFQWVREVPGDGFGEMNLGNRNFLAVDNTGKIYISGSTSRTIEWGNSVVSSIPGNSSDIALLQYDADGTIRQIITAGGDSGDRADGISIDDNGAIYASGMVFQEANFGTFSHTDPAYFPFLTKINPALKNNTVVKGTALLYPNPARDLIYFHHIESGKGTIYNLLGQALLNFKIEAGTPVSVSNLPSGTYMVAVDGFKTQKLIKE